MMIPMMPLRWLAHALGLRRAYTGTTLAEQAALTRWARGRRSLLEIGTDEGANSLNLRRAMDQMAVLYLIDPFVPGRLGVNFSYLIARREVAKCDNGRVVFLRKKSEDAAKDWHEPLDLVFVDADHSKEAALGDWRSWAPHLVVGGVLAFHDARLFAGGWTEESWGSVQAVREILDRKHPLPGKAFDVLEMVDSLVALERVT
jgi:predicted O-methyltransferase YrrM